MLTAEEMESTRDKAACWSHCPVHSPASASAAGQGAIPLLTNTLAVDGRDTTEGRASLSAQRFLSACSMWDTL